MCLYVYRSRFTSIAVDWRVLAADRRRYDVIFVGTGPHRLLRQFKTSDVAIGVCFGLDPPLWKTLAPPPKEVSPRCDLILAALYLLALSNLYSYETA